MYRRFLVPETFHADEFLIRGCGNRGQDLVGIKQVVKLCLYQPDEQ